MIPGYRVAREIYRGRTKVVYRAIREGDLRPVILKTLTEDFPGSADLFSLKREFEIIDSLRIEGIARALSLEKIRNKFVLILDDIGGETLRTLLDSDEEIPEAPFLQKNGRLNLFSFLEAAIRLVSAVLELHQRNIIHKDINPKNIILNPRTNQLQLIDFGISSLLPREEQTMIHPDFLEGTLAYISPEQTGRMNRALDYRTDFYSLGVTFFEMLTGRLPFLSEDPMELVHSHIAKTPDPVSELNPSVPRALSRIISKLMAKAAEDRYISAIGLRNDMQRCLDGLQKEGYIPDFSPGEQDVSDRFNIPQRLYGRSREIETLLNTFERVCQGGLEMLFVFGYSGIGKTSLIHEIYKPVVRHKAYFISGKFDQLNRIVPYSGFIQAFQELARIILTESSERIESWKRTLLEKLGPNGQLIIDVIPEMELIIGKQPPVPILGPKESENRFHLVFQNFISAFAEENHPLVLFLDDLQWADAGSLRLFPLLAMNPELHHLFLLGAYRDNEVNPGHPLMLMLYELQKAGAKINRVSVTPLTADDLNQFVSDILLRDQENSSPLSRLVMNKTYGNPFFVTQFMRSLQQEGLLKFDYGLRGWDYSLEQIEERAMTDNVVDLMAGKIQSFPQETQEVLKLAACIGNRFDLHTLSTVHQKPPRATYSDLWRAIMEGLVLPMGNAYSPGVIDDLESGDTFPPFRFLHDRVQQAAYVLIPESSKKEVHLQVGRLMLASSTPAERQERVFEIVNHLNFGADLVSDPEEVAQLIELNLAAGRKAKSSTAYKAALSYFQMGENLLTEDCWKINYPLCFELFCELAECEYLTGNFEKAEQYFDLLLERARTELEKAAVYKMRIVQYENMARYADAVDTAKQALELLGVHLPSKEEEKQADFESEMRSISSHVNGTTIEELAGLPDITDRKVKMMINLLMTAWAPAYIAGDGALCRLLSAKMVRYSLQYGNTEESAYGYVTHAITVGSLLGDYKSGYEYGRVALAVNEKFQDLKLRSKTQHMFSCFVNLWRKPLRSCFAHSREAFRCGLETGDFTYATYAIFHESWYGLLAGNDLRAFLADYTPNLAFLNRIKNYSFVDAQQVILHWGMNLQGLTKSRLSLSSDSFEESLYLEKYKSDPFFITFYLVAKLHTLYTFGAYVEAKSTAERAEQVAGALSGTIWPALLTSGYALTLAALWPGNGEQEWYEQKLAQLEQQLKVWGENSPENFLTQSLLVSAEIERIHGNREQAMELYEQAIRYAGEQELLREEAFANELTGRFWLAKNRSIARLYFSQAHYAYTQWGAFEKAKDLEEKYSNLLFAADARRATSTTETLPTLLTTHAKPGSIDISAVIQAAQAISGEIEMERLLEVLVRIVLENAGAQRGLLIQEGVAKVAAFVEQSRIRVISNPKPSETYCQAVVNYVQRTCESLVIGDAMNDPRFSSDLYVTQAKPRSVIAAPILYHGKLIAVLYLENNLAVHAFTPERIELVKILASQAAISLENARLYDETRQEIAQRKRAEEALRAALDEVEQLKNRLQAENIYLQEEIKTHSNFEEIIGVSPAMKKIYENLDRVGPTDTTVLITGETGTGKELVARAIHNLSKRRESALIKVNCSTLPHGLIESELFGHEKGAFTGAAARKKGRFELADGGSIFLDEIGELSLDVQTKLLRVLQEHEFERVGGSQTIKVNVRVISATNRNLEEMVHAGTFRADLFYRLNIFPVHLPPLRDRREDIPLLTQYFIEKFAVRAGKKIDQMSPEVMERLLQYEWSGNIRELANVIERAVILCEGSVIQPAHIAITRPIQSKDSQLLTLEESERTHILKALEKTKWVVGGPSGAAKLLGMNRTTLLARMKRLGIERPH